MGRKKRSRLGGSGHRHSSKAERKARHIASSEHKKGMGKKRAKSIAWATVHKDMPHSKREKKES